MPEEERQNTKKRIIDWIISGVIGIILINIGIQNIIEPRAYPGVIIALIGIALLYFSYYAFQIRINEKKIKEFEEWKESKEELLNTLKDIIILKKISKIK